MPIRSPSGNCRQRTSFSSSARCTAGSYIWPGTARSIGSGASSVVDCAVAGRAALRPLHHLLSTQVQAHAEQHGALLQRIRRRAFQIEAEVKWRARAARPPDLLTTELLAHHALAINLRHQL